MENIKHLSVKGNYLAVTGCSQHRLAREGSVEMSIYNHNMKNAVVNTTWAHDLVELSRDELTGMKYITDLR